MLTEKFYVNFLTAVVKDFAGNFDFCEELNEVYIVYVGF